MIFKAAQVLAFERGGATWRELAHYTQVGNYTARRAVENMIKAGELQVIGKCGRRRFNVVVPAAVGPGAEPPLDLATVMKSWQPLPIPLTSS